ncbi:hypothetical protein TSUD_141500 [Trifolium subterraneum]|uniref:Uncharacterized protein n=1 Tax=Trifolium subterraneum TaxID=3900 RepID=A0A2Z6PUR6_TRISU|nr:hypothetical protein TSUD_141500 [Trifolium subterraneum]
MVGFEFDQHNEGKPSTSKSMFEILVETFEATPIKGVEKDPSKKHSDHCSTL